MVLLASDHGGYKLKNEIMELLDVLELEYEDFGPYEYTPEDDYPKFISPAMENLSNNPENKAILICRNGIGVSILANKYKGVRCALSWSSEHVKSSRWDDDSNALALPSDYIDTTTAKEIVETWLTTEFSKEERHKRRLEKIKNLP